MTINDTKTNYRSAWSIDQATLPSPRVTTITIPASPDGGTTPGTATGTFAHNLGYLPNIDATYQVDSSGTWHQCGLPDGFTLAHWNVSGGSGYFYPGMLSTMGCAVAYGFDTTNVYLNALNYDTASHVATVRLYLTADKVDY